jgi:polyisoprenyl-phosphate glycosyltransferase
MTKIYKRPATRLIVVMPLRDDWVSAAELIKSLDKAIYPDNCTMDVILIDDCSVQRCDPADFQSGFSVVRTIRSLRLRRNLGHQRAIAIGLAHVQQSASCDVVVVMDSDGEDTPDGVAQLLHAYSNNHGTRAIFAERSRRPESFAFRCAYQLYRFLHRYLTGINVRVGNFSVLPSAYLNTLVAMSELWNHYAGAVLRSKLPFTTIPIPKGKRIAGTSTMNLVAFVSHGLSAISVFGDIVGVRVLIGSLTASLVACFGIVAVAAIRFFTNQAIPGWATNATGILAIIMVQLVTIATSFTFFVLSSRTNLGFIPLRDYSLFVEKAVDIYSHE